MAEDRHGLQFVKLQSFEYCCSTVVLTNRERRSIEIAFTVYSRRLALQMISRATTRTDTTSRDSLHNSCVLYAKVKSNQPTPFVVGWAAFEKLCLPERTG